MIWKIGLAVFYSSFCVWKEGCYSAEMIECLYTYFIFGARLRQMWLSKPYLGNKLLSTR